MVFAYITPNKFFEIINRLKSLNESAGVQHSLMFFEGIESIILYKPVAEVVYATTVSLDEERNISNISGTNVEETENSTLLGSSPDSFKLKLLKEFQAVELVQPLDISLILQQHTHDVHSHGGSGFNDIQI